MRTIIEISDEQLKGLSYICERKNISRAELIRQAISLYLQENISVKNDYSFGIWKNKAIDSVDYQNKLREEWE